MPDSEDRMFARALAWDFPYNPTRVETYLRHPATKRRIALYGGSFEIREKSWPSQSPDYIDMVRAHARIALEHLTVVHFELGVERGSDDEPSKVFWYAYAYPEQNESEREHDVEH